jgi:hypothetical protein
VRQPQFQLRPPRRFNAALESRALAMATEHTMDFEPADRLAKDRESVRKRFWIKFKRGVVKLPFAEDLLAAYY